MFGRKRIEELERKVNLLNELLKKETENSQQVRRIVRYAKDDRPTFLTDWKRVMSDGFWDEEFWIYIYIYINKEEYYIHLEDFDNTLIYPFDRYFDLEVTDGLAYLTYDEPKNNHIYRFVIDYKRGTYVLNQYDRKEEKKKEEPKCTDC